MDRHGWVLIRVRIAAREVRAVHPISWGWQFTASQALDEVYVPFFGPFGAAWEDATVARWSPTPLGPL